MAVEGGRGDGGDGAESGDGVGVTVQKSPEAKLILEARTAVATAFTNTRRMKLVKEDLTKTPAQLEETAVEAENVAKARARG